MIGDLTPKEKEAADWLESHWLEIVTAGPLTKVLRERFGLPFNPAVRAIAEVKRRRDKN